MPFWSGVSYVRVTGSEPVVRRVRRFFQSGSPYWFRAQIITQDNLVSFQRKHPREVIVQLASTGFDGFAGVVFSKLGNPEPRWRWV